ncbi:Endonuclease IV [Granulicatella balaenopterae]|uniref:Probable endonuclease 4 n=1 Tax=Granulicatella balaenopterae TaxID=137733 RepID=A0A1H9GU70_9LACT|nr:deoxyribonuclease IV [Granulicatella balaenopterae]SEQ53676.1 Endonuclease IV [Granulicatella balaenopterae]
MLIGSHVSMKGKEMLLGSAKEANSYQANVLMVYTGAPQNTKRKPIEEMNIQAGQNYMEEHGLEEVVVHAPYIINLGNTIKPGYLDFAIDFLREEIKRAEAVGAKQLVLHPGAHVKAGTEAGLAQIIKGLNEVIDREQKLSIALETMAGKGTELGRTFEELATIIDGVHYNEKLSITFDTCHVHDAGYNIKEDLSGVLTKFDKIIGLDRLQVLHVNDSKNICGAKKDRHANFGFGEIGFEALMQVVNEPIFKDIPKILETPWVGEDKKNQVAPYQREIDMIRKNQFDPMMLEKLMAQ